MRRPTGPPPRPRPTASPSSWSASEIERRRLVEQGLAVFATREADPALVDWAANVGAYLNAHTSRDWRNPFLPEDGNPRRLVELYRQRIERKLASRLPEVAGRVIVCGCGLGDGECHGRALVAAANRLGPGPVDRRPRPDPTFAPTPTRTVVQQGRRPRKAA